MKLKENSLMVFNYVKEHQDENIIADDIANATGLSSRQVNGIITMAFQRHKEEIDGEKIEVPLMERIPAEIELEDGTHKQVKLIRLTDEGMQLDVEAE